MRRIRLVIYHGSRFVLAGVFLYAGVVKALDPVGFAGEVANYRMLPYSWNFLVAGTLPYVELLAGLLLLVNRKVRPAALVIGGMTLVFMIALGSVLARGLDIDCGCFRPGAHSTPLAALWRDAGLLLLAHVSFWWAPASRT
jgi:uncharacterized membrane protein YphA (DoxX/SURF4 family)